MRDIQHHIGTDKPARMQAIADLAIATLGEPVPFMQIEVDDNIASSVHIRGSFDRAETWKYGIIHNSRYFQFHISPINRKRYYDPSDAKVTVECLTMDRSLPKFRKYTGAPDKVIAKIQAWIESVKG